MTDISAHRSHMSDEPTYDLSAVDEPPRLVNRSELMRQLSRNYPPLLRDAGIVGDVSVRFRVRSTGEVDVESLSIESSTHETFDDAALRSARRMRFAPGRIGGTPVDVWTIYPLEFHLS